MLAPPDIDDACADGGRRDRQVAILDRLTVMGMAIAEAIHREIEAGLPDETDSTKRIAALNTAAVAHARAARAVRLALMLQGRLLAGGHPAPAAANDPFNPAGLIVEWLPYDRGPDGADANEERAEGSGGDHDARPDRERDDALLSLPPAEVIARICRDLGLDDETAHRFQTRWNAERAAGAPSDPAREAGKEKINHQGRQGHQEDRPGPEPSVSFHARL